MADHTAQSAADYLAAQGYTIEGGGRTAGRHAPPPDIIRRWCKSGKLKARRVGYIWLIEQTTLDALVAAQED